jgi:sugar O-acyltransferase (sialic acid O-acetyltransferase NeuD family)
VQVSRLEPKEANFMEVEARLVLFSAGSPLIVDYEEAARSCSREILAIVRNMDLPSPALGQDRIIGAHQLAGEYLDGAEVLVPLFTPGNRLRATIEFGRIRDKIGAKVAFGRLVHGSAIVARSAEIDEGCFINAGVVISGMAKLGRHVVVNRSASVGHHVTAEEFVSFGPGSICAGEISIGRGSFIGAGAVIHPQVSIGVNAVVAAGAVVRKSVPDRCMVAGHPAKIVKRDIVGYGGVGVPETPA